jgi:anti-sigma B factor antagonist
MDDLFNGAGAGSTVYADRHLVVTRTDDPPGLRFAGEIDVTNASAVGQAIRVGFVDTMWPHVDLRQLSFCDVSGIRALVDAARALGDDAGLLLHGLPPQLETVMRVTGWSKIRSLSLCKCGGPE